MYSLNNTLELTFRMLSLLLGPIFSNPPASLVLIGAVNMAETLLPSQHHVLIWEPQTAQCMAERDSSSASVPSYQPVPTMQTGDTKAEVYPMPSQVCPTQEAE